jgi:hypothetical protein
MSVLNGPSEGTWSVMAGKWLEERDQARQELYEAKLEIDRLKSVIKNLESATVMLSGKNY